MSYPREIVRISIDAFEGPEVVDAVPQIIELRLHFGWCITLQFGQSFRPLGLREETHLAGAHSIGEHEHDDVLRFDADIFAEFLHTFGSCETQIFRKKKKKS